MQPSPPPRVRLATSAVATLRQEVGNRRGRFVKALTAINFVLPRVAEDWRPNRVSGQPNAFLYRHHFTDDGHYWWIDCVVGDAGWPTTLWLVDVFVTEGGPVD